MYELIKEFFSLKYDERRCPKCGSHSLLLVTHTLPLICLTPSLFKRLFKRHHHYLRCSDCRTRELFTGTVGGLASWWFGFTTSVALLTFVTLTILLPDYTTSFLRNHMILTSIMGMFFLNTIWIIKNFNSFFIFRKQNHYKYTIRLSSIFCIVIINIFPLVMLHAVNTLLDDSECIIIHGNLESIRKRKMNESDNYKWVGSFYVNEKGYTGYMEHELSHGDYKLAKIKLCVRKGFLGWEWISSKSVIESF